MALAFFLIVFVEKNVFYQSLSFLTVTFLNSSSFLPRVRKGGPAAWPFLTFKNHAIGQAESKGSTQMRAGCTGRNLRTVCETTADFYFLTDTLNALSHTVEEYIKRLCGWSQEFPAFALSYPLLTMVIVFPIVILGTEKRKKNLCRATQTACKNHKLEIIEKDPEVTPRCW